MRVKEWQGEVVFLHEVVPGAADRSYGIQVAKLAGLPAAVIERAKLVLAKLEAGRPRRAARASTTCRCSPRAARRRGDAGRRARADGRRRRRAQSRRHVAARGDGSALPAEGKAGADGEEVAVLTARSRAGARSRP